MRQKEKEITNLSAREKGNNSSSPTLPERLSVIDFKSKKLAEPDNRILKGNSRSTISFTA